MWALAYCQDEQTLYSCLSRNRAGVYIYLEDVQFKEPDVKHIMKDYLFLTCVRWPSIPFFQQFFDVLSIDTSTFYGLITFNLIPRLNYVLSISRLVT